MTARQRWYRDYHNCRVGADYFWDKYPWFSRRAYVYVWGTRPNRLRYLVVSSAVWQKITGAV